MAKKLEKVKKILIEQEKGAFSSILKRIKGSADLEKIGISEISLIRSLLTPEKARMLHILKTKQPNSIYELAKQLGRDFKTVRDDAKLLEKLGLIELIPVHKGKRQKLKPILVVSSLEVKFNF